MIKALEATKFSKSSLIIPIPPRYVLTVEINISPNFKLETVFEDISIDFLTLADTEPVSLLILPIST